MCRQSYADGRYPRRVISISIVNYCKTYSARDARNLGPVGSSFCALTLHRFLHIIPAPQLTRQWRGSHADGHTVPCRRCRRSSPPPPQPQPPPPPPPPAHALQQPPLLIARRLSEAADHRTVHREARHPGDAFATDSFGTDAFLKSSTVATPADALRSRFAPNLFDTESATAADALRHGLSAGASSAFPGASALLGFALDRAQPTKELPVLNEGAECSAACDGKVGFCPTGFCGSGLCCARGVDFAYGCGLRGCTGFTTGPSDGFFAVPLLKRCCTAPSPPSPPPAPPAPPPLSPMPPYTPCPSPSPPHPPSPPGSPTSTSPRMSPHLPLPQSSEDELSGSGVRNEGAECFDACDGHRGWCPTGFC
eukprot:4618536-Pleurochrysis_carterae.AAC.2